MLRIVKQAIVHDSVSASPSQYVGAIDQNSVMLLCYGSDGRTKFVRAPENQVIELAGEDKMTLCFLPVTDFDQESGEAIMALGKLGVLFD